MLFAAIQMSLANPGREARNAGAAGRFSGRRDIFRDSGPPAELRQVDCFDRPLPGLCPNHPKIGGEPILPTAAASSINEIDVPGTDSPWYHAGLEAEAFGAESFASQGEGGRLIHQETPPSKRKTSKPSWKSRSRRVRGSRPFFDGR